MDTHDVDPQQLIGDVVSGAVERAFGPEYAGVDPIVRPSDFADVQSNVAMALAKRVKLPPREVATRIAEDAELAKVAGGLEVSGPGFLNITFADDWLTGLVTEAIADERAGVPVREDIVVPIDYSAPNVAKEMHVGHLRTTVVGDALARTLEHLGRRVVRQNHVGDWGTPFGMLIEHLTDVGEDSDEARLLETDPNAFYQAARTKFESDDAFATRSRNRVVSLQAGDTETLRRWQALVDLSKHYFNRIYTQLGVTLTDADLAGESMYNDDLAAVCDELEQAGIAVHSDGALCVFLDGYTGREGKPVPLIIRKSDGGYGYATTDLATVRYRIRTLGAKRILYVIGAPQSLHLNMVWDTARKAGWVPDDVEIVHVQIGNVLGSDRKILRTRSGAPLRLAALLDEAEATARAVLDESRPDLPESDRAAIAPMVGMGAVKYADLSVAHNSEYVFDLARMTALTGNTGPYLQYAVARIRSMLRDAPADATTDVVALGEPQERALAIRLLGFGAAVTAVDDDLEPHRLAAYLFELAQEFSRFYEHCPVLRAEPEVRDARLTLCRLTERVLVQGLALLGIEAPERM